MAEEQYDSLDSVLSGRISKVNESPRPTRPDTSLLQQHQANLAVGAAQEPGFLRGLGEMAVAPVGGYTPGLQPSNVRDLPIMKNYPLPSSGGQALSNVGSFAKGAFQTGVSPLIDLSRTAYNDITQSPWQEKGLKTFEHAITNPMQQTMEKGMDESLPAVEAAGHRGLSVLPVIGPWASDVLSNSLPKALFGQTGEERSAGAGEIAGPILAGKAIGTVANKAGMAYNKSGANRLSKAEARIAVAADIPQETVHEALPFVDKFMKDTRGVDYRGRPLSSSIVESGKRGLEGHDIDTAAPLARAAVNDFHEKNIAPIEDQLQSIQADFRPVLKRATDALGPIFKEQLQTTRAPVEMRAIARLLNKTGSLNDLFDIRQDLNGRLNVLQAKSNLPKQQFLKAHPQARFLNEALNGVREFIDSTIDVNSGNIGQTAGVLKTFARMKEFADGLEAGAERSKGMETQRLGKRMGKLPVEAATGGAIGGLYGSKARAIGEVARSVKGSANLPNKLIPSAGKLIERRGMMGLLPSGRSALSQPLDINYGSPIGPGSNYKTGPIFDQPESPQAPSEPFNIPPNYQAEPNPVQPPQGLNQVQAPQQLPQAPMPPPQTTTPPQVNLPEGQTPKALKAGTYNLGEGDFYDTIKKEAIRPPEGKIKPPRKPEEKLKVSENRSVRPKEGELNVKKSTEESGQALNISDKRSEFTAPQRFSTVPERMQKQESRQETVSRLAERVKGKSSAPEQSTVAPVKEQPSIESKPTEQKAQPQAKAPKESKWEAKEAGKGMVDLYKNGVKMFDKPLPAAEAQKWTLKRQAEEKSVRKFYDEGEKGAVNLTSDEEARFPEKLVLPDGHEATRGKRADFGPGYEFMSYDVTKSHDKNYVGSTLYFDLNSKDPVKDFQAKIDEHPSLKVKKD